MLNLTGTQTGDVQVALGRTLEARGETRQAIQYYAEAVRNDPTRADAWMRLAVLSDKEGLFAESAQYHHRVIAILPNSPDGYCNLGYSFYLQQRWGDAEAALRKAVELQPDHQRAQNNLGLVLARSGREAEALEAFGRGGCGKADSHLNLAYALTLNGDWAQARSQYENALALQPDSEAARKGIKNVEALVAKLETPNVSLASPTIPAGAHSGKMSPPELPPNLPPLFPAEPK